MTKHQWKRSKKSFRSHLEPEVEEQLKWIKIEMESNVRRSLKLVKNMNSNREGNLKKKGEVMQIIQDIQKEYQSLYDFYNNLRDEVRKKIKGADEDSSSTSSSSDSELYHTPEELISRSIESGKESGGKEIENNNQEQDTSDSEKSVLKDILTSTSEVKKSLSLDSLSSTDEVPEIGEIVKDLKLQAEQSESRIEQLLDECAHLKDKLVEKEEEILSVNKNDQDFRKQKSDDLESQVKVLKLELETILEDKRDFEGQVECKSNEVKQLKEENLSLQVRISELESLLGSKDEQLSSLLNQHEQENTQSASKLDGLMGQVKNLELEVDSLCCQKCKLEEQLAHENEKISAQVSEFTKQISSLEQELELVNSKKNQLELNLEEKSKEVEQCIGQIETLKEKLDSQDSQDNTTTKEKLKELEIEVTSLSNQRSELEDRILRTNTEADNLKMEKEEVERKNIQLERNLKERENEKSVQKTQFRAKEDEMSSQVIALNVSIKSFQQKLENVQKEKKGLQLQLDTEKQTSSEKLTQMTGKNIELTNKIAEQQKSLIEMENVIKKLNEEIKQVRTQLADSTRSYQLAERRIEEMADEFFKKFEDNLRILSRRILVSEQLHIENKELYKKTKAKYENQNKDLKEKLSKNEVGLKNMKEMSLTAYEMLSSVDSDALRFEECTANFLNRMSKVSCELKFSKDWIMRKNKGMLHVKDELDCLLAQLDDKEAEILVFREKVWKSENKIRELEKIIKHREDSMLVLQEEKREAIRQLCVWIDYHRSRSDYYKKMLADITARYKRTT